MPWSDWQPGYLANQNQTMSLLEASFNGREVKITPPSSGVSPQADFETLRASLASGSGTDNVPHRTTPPAGAVSDFFLPLMSIADTRGGGVTTSVSDGTNTYSIDITSSAETLDFGYVSYYVSLDDFGGVNDIINNTKFPPGKTAADFIFPPPGEGTNVDGNGYLDFESPFFVDGPTFNSITPGGSIVTHGPGSGDTPVVYPISTFPLAFFIGPAPSLPTSPLTQGPNLAYGVSGTLIGNADVPMSTKTVPGTALTMPSSPTSDFGIYVQCRAQDPSFAMTIGTGASWLIGSRVRMSIRYHTGNTPRWRYWIPGGIGWGMPI